MSTLLFGGDMKHFLTFRNCAEFYDSEVLSGKRRLNARQIARLAARFHMLADMFLGEEPGRLGCKK
jgi:hypothetical protein